MNVEYRCTGCGRRLFAKPGGTRLKCSKGHIEPMEYKQVEGWDGPDMLYIDEQGKTESKDVIGPENTRDVQHTQTIATFGMVDSTGGTGTLVVTDPGDVELNLARSMYEQLTGLTCDKRWGVSRIREELQETLANPGPEVDSDSQVVDTSDQELNEGGESSDDPDPAPEA